MLLLSIARTVFVASMLASRDVVTTVGSSVVFPSVSSPSSLMSVTLLVWPGVLPVAWATLLIEPVLAELTVMVYLAV